MPRRSKLLDAVSSEGKDVETILLKRCVMGDELARWAYADWLEENGRDEEAAEVRNVAGVVPFEVVNPPPKREDQSWKEYRQQVANLLGDPSLERILDNAPEQYIWYGDRWYRRSLDPTAPTEAPFFHEVSLKEDGFPSLICRCGNVSMLVSDLEAGMFLQCPCCHRGQAMIWGEDDIHAFSLHWIDLDEVDLREDY